MKIDLICPTCQENIAVVAQNSDITCSACNEEFPVVGGTPILLSINNELFNKNTFSNQASSGFNLGFSAKISKFLPKITLNKFEDDALNDFIFNLKSDSKCLIIGAGYNHYLKYLLTKNNHRTVVTDVFASDIVDYVCDATNLPFSSSQFDVVLIIAVLEHVVEPNIAVAEISRVLKKDGLVFSGIPFMQQVHMGEYDFTRYTLLGHRWLYNSFELVKLAPSSGAGSALLWSMTSFFRSFTSSKVATLIIKSFIRVFFFWIKYFDLLQKNSADFALGSYFIVCNKKSITINKRQLVDLYGKK